MNRERGFIMVWAMLLVVVFAGASVTMLARGQILAREMRHDTATLRAMYAAEGGVAYARHKLARDPGFAGATIRVGACDVAVTVAGGKISVVVRPQEYRLDADLR